MISLPNLQDTLPRWTLIDHNKAIQRQYQFKNFYETMAFVNALAWIAHQANHHPDLEIGYNYCRIKYTTHDAGGITEKDLACAKQVDALLK